MQVGKWASCGKLWIDRCNCLALINPASLPSMYVRSSICPLTITLTPSRMSQDIFEDAANFFNNGLFVKSKSSQSTATSSSSSLVAVTMDMMLGDEVRRIYIAWRTAGSSRACQGERLHQSSRALLATVSQGADDARWERERGRGEDTRPRWDIRRQTELSLRERERGVIILMAT